MAKRCNGVEIHWSTITGVTVKDHVSTATLCERFDRLRPVIAQVIDHCVRAKLLDKCELVLTTHQTDDPCSRGLGNLYDQRPHRACRGVHHHPLTRFDLSGAVYEQPGGVRAG